MSSVRQEIITNIIAGLASLDAVHTVIDSGDHKPKISDAIALGKCFAEIAVESDVPLSDKPMNLEKNKFRVIVQIFWPGTYREEDLPVAIATDLHFDVYGLYVASEDDDGTWGDKALSTEGLGGGGYGFSEVYDGLTQVESAFEVTYRHRRGDPEAAA